MSEAADIWDHAIRYLQVLRRDYGFAASESDTGLYSTLFGRDSLWILIFLISGVRLCNPEGFREWVEQAAIDILSSLARYQGTSTRNSVEEQPGKIVHEYRETLDERLIRMKIPFEDHRSYSGFDETFLFIIAFCAFAELSPKHEVLNQALIAFEKALEWVERTADEDGDGLFEYSRRDRRNLLHQCWRDSFDSVTISGTDVPQSPVAWLSCQGYAYRALVSAAKFYAIRSNSQKADVLYERAKALKQKTRDLFWMPDESCYAIALDGYKEQVPLVSSDNGHVLWSGIVDEPLHSALVERMFRDDMMTSFGLRTLSSESPFFSPFSYHRGNIWPFDNAISSMALLENGYADRCRKLIQAVWRAVSKFDSPVELFVVLDSDLLVQPTTSDDLLFQRRRIPENRIQGWTAAGLAYMSTALAHLNGERLQWPIPK
jgi:glycogen debranching enzyme